MEEALGATGVIRMRVRYVARAAVACLMVTGGLAIAAPASGPPLAAVARLEPGEWQLKAVGAAPAPRSLCLADATVLIQYGHSALQCQRVVITNEADVATVHYTCPGTGHGRTTFKVATPRAFNLETQGILNGAPFEEAYEAHRIGACALGAAAAR